MLEFFKNQKNGSGNLAEHWKIGKTQAVDILKIKRN